MYAFRYAVNVKTNSHWTIPLFNLCRLPKLPEHIELQGTMDNGFEVWKVRLPASVTALVVKYSGLGHTVGYYHSPIGVADELALMFPATLSKVKAPTTSKYGRQYNSAAAQRRKALNK